MAQNKNNRNEPTYNLKAVVQKTGLKPDTLRAWERRYGLPQPQRTSGGHRIYSAQDIAILKWLVARQQEGLSISRAVNLWEQLKTEGKNPLQIPAYRSSPPPIPAPIYPEGNTVAELRQEWIEGCLLFDEQRAEAVLNQAFSFYPPEMVCFELLQKGLAKIGRSWAQDTATVQQEHFASSLAIRRIEALIVATPTPTRSETVLIGCPPHEEHIFGPLLLTWLLRRHGWEVSYLGANIPVDQLGDTIEMIKPHFVIMAAQSLYTASALLDVAWLLEEEKISLGFGGLVFNLIPELRNHIPGHFLGERLDISIQRVEQLIINSIAPPPAELASKHYQEALFHYQEHQAAIEAEVWKEMKIVGILQRHLINANIQLTQNLKAVLKLGNINLLSPTMDWLDHLLFEDRMPREKITSYIEAYYHAAQRHLDKPGQLILDWLAQLKQEVKT